MPNPRTTRAAQSILKAREDAIAQVRDIDVNRNHTNCILNICVNNYIYNRKFPKSFA